MPEVPAADEFADLATNETVIEIDLDDGEHSPCQRVPHIVEVERPPFVELPDALKGMYYLG